MAVINSNGGRVSDTPCGFPPVCTNEVWADWRATAVTIRDLVIKTRKPGAEESTARRVWLSAWAPGVSPLKIPALQTEADPDLEKLRWEKDPGLLWWKPRLYALVNYTVRGANILKAIGGQDMLVEPGPPIRGYFRSAAIGGVLALLGIGTVYYYTKD